MLTLERLTALEAVRDGKVIGKGNPGPYSPQVLHPREHIVAIGYLMKAGLVERHGKFVELTDRGRDVLTRIHS